MSLPAQQTEGAYRIGVVCLGNICRSPMAEVVLSALVDRAGLAARVHVESSGTGDWHLGDRMDVRASATLTAAGYDPTAHRAQQYDDSWRRDFDLVLVMDRSNLHDLGGADERVRLFRSFDPVEPGGEVPDPYYGGEAGFEEVLTMVERTAATIVAELERELLRT